MVVVVAARRGSQTRVKAYAICYLGGGLAAEHGLAHALGPGKSPRKRTKVRC